MPRYRFARTLMVRFFAVLPAPRMMPIRRVVCWRLEDLAQWIFEDFGISLDETTLGRELKALGFRKLSARLRHHAKNGDAVEDFKKVSPASWQRSEPSCLLEPTAGHRGLVAGRGPGRAEEQDHAALGQAGDAPFGTP